MRPRSAPEVLWNALTWAGVHVGIGASRKMGKGRFTLTPPVTTPASGAFAFADAGAFANSNVTHTARQPRTHTANPAPASTATPSPSLRRRRRPRVSSSVPQTVPGAPSSRIHPAVMRMPETSPKGASFTMTSPTPQPRPRQPQAAGQQPAGERPAPLLPGVPVPGLLPSRPPLPAGIRAKKWVPADPGVLRRVKAALDRL
jgi:hypothetical protein